MRSLNSRYGEVYFPEELDRPRSHELGTRYLAQAGFKPGRRLASGKGTARMTKVGAELRCEERTSEATALLPRLRSDRELAGTRRVVSVVRHNRSFPCWLSRGVVACHFKIRLSRLCECAAFPP